MQSLRNLEDVSTAFDSNASQIDRKRKTCSDGNLGKSSSHTSKRTKLQNSIKRYFTMNDE